MINIKELINKNKPQNTDIVAGYALNNYLLGVDFIPQIFVYITRNSNKPSKNDFDFSKMENNSVTTIEISELHKALLSYDADAWNFVYCDKNNIVFYDEKFETYVDCFANKLLVSGAVDLIKNMLQKYNKTQADILTLQTKVTNNKKDDKETTQLINIANIIFNKLIKIGQYSAVFEYFQNRIPIEYAYNFTSLATGQSKDAISITQEIFEKLPPAAILLKPEIIQKILPLYNKGYFIPTTQSIKYKWKNETPKIDNDINNIYNCLIADGDTIIKVIYHSNIDKINIISQGDWIDLRLAEDVYLKKGEIGLFSLGVTIKLPKGYEAIVAPRSSLGMKYGVIQLNSLGVIDNSYCGDNDIWKIPLYAIRDTTIERNTRVCQFRLLPTQKQSLGKIKFKEIVKGEESTENRGGFGSTGDK